jgi:hypothetical protein
LNERAMELVAANTSKPFLFVVSKEDRRGFRDMTRAYSLSRSPGSDIWIQDGLGVGMTMCNMWRNRYVDRSIDRALDVEMGEWLEKKLLGLGTGTEVTLKTEDGWVLYANLVMPNITEDRKSVPGVILLPTALTDRKIYHNLERLLVANDIAVLNLEYRGIGNSINMGAYIDYTYSKIMAGRRDLQEGFRFLISQEGVDPDRIGALGAILGAKYVLYAAKENPGLKAIAMLDPVVWPWDESEDRETVETLGRQVLVVTGNGMGRTTRAFAELVAKKRMNTVISYPGSIVTYLRFRDDASLEPGLAQWFRERLGG